MSGPPTRLKPVAEFLLALKPLGGPPYKWARYAPWDSPEIADTFFNGERARKVGDGNYPRKFGAEFKCEAVRQLSALRIRLPPDACREFCNLTDRTLS